MVVSMSGLAKRIILGSISSVIALTVIVQPFLIAPSAYAGGTEIEDHVRKVLEMYAVANCFNHSGITKDPGEVVNSNWFSTATHKIPFASLPPGVQPDHFGITGTDVTWAEIGAFIGKKKVKYSDNGNDNDMGSGAWVKCDDSEGWLSTFISELGYGGTIEAFCAAGAKRGGGTGSSCVGGSGNFDLPGDAGSHGSSSMRTAFIANTAPKIGMKDASTPFNDAERYWWALNTFISGCGATAAGDYTGSPEQMAFIDSHQGTGVVTIDPATGKGLDKKIFYKTGLKTDEETVAWAFNGDWVGDRCSELVNTANSTAAAYATYVKANPQDTQTHVSGDDSGSGSSQQTCSSEIGGIAWIVCPVMNFVAELADKAFKFIANQFLVVHIGLFDENSGTKTAWNIFRTYANIAFIIAFLAIIFSQITGLGINNYGIKRMLPRLIAAAILVNISYYLCQFAVDMSNVLGYGLKNLFDSIHLSGGAGTDAVPEWKQMMGKILAGTIVAALGVIFLLAISAPVLLAAILAVAMIAIILIAREAAIVLLIAVSPLAFVAYLLPNTEQWFKKWWKMFSTLLMVFPVIGVIFGASSLASRIINVSATQSDTDDSVVLQVTALAMAMIPFYAAPTALKGAMTATGAVGAKLQGWGNRATGRFGKQAIGKSRERWNNSIPGRYGKYRSGEAAKRNALIQAGQYHGKGGRLNPRNWRSSAYERFNDSKFSGKFGDATAASGVGLADKQEEEQVADRIKLMKRRATPGSEIGDARAEFRRALASGDAVGQQAAIRILGNSGNPGLQALHEEVAQAERSNNLTSANSGLVKKEVAGLNLKARDNSLESWARDTSASTLDSQVASGSRASSLTTAELMGQDYLHLHTLASNGHISQAQAQAVLADPNQAGIAQDKRALMQALSSGSALPTLNPTVIPGSTRSQAQTRTDIYG